MSNIKPITVIFVIYLAIILIFSLIYYNVYENSASNFSFNNEILNTQKLTFENSAAEEIQEISNIVNLLNQLDTALILNNCEIKYPTFWNKNVQIKTSNTIYLFSTNHSLQKKRGLVFSFLSIKDLNETELFKLSIPNNIANPKDLNECRMSVETLLNFYNNEFIAINKKIESISTSTPDIWNYIDFLYFSTITQSTIGYGDILPNSTTVRLLVVIQTIISSMILIIFLNNVILNVQNPVDKKTDNKSY